MREEGYASGYEYDHDAEGAVSGQAYFPDALEPQRFYRPTEYGMEQRLGERLAMTLQRREKRARERVSESESDE